MRLNLVITLAGSVLGLYCSPLLVTGIILATAAFVIWDFVMSRHEIYSAEAVIRFYSIALPYVGLLFLTMFTTSFFSHL